MDNGLKVASFFLVLPVTEVTPLLYKTNFPTSGGRRYLHDTYMLLCQIGKQYEVHLWLLFDISMFWESTARHSMSTKKTYKKTQITGMIYMSLTGEK